MALAKGYPAKRDIHKTENGGKLVAGSRKKAASTSSKKRAAPRKKSK